MITVLKFSASWCKPCQAFLPIFKQVEEHFKDKDIDFTEIDIENESEAASTYNIKSVPTIIILDSNKEVVRLIGTTSKNELIYKINKLL